MDSQETIGVSPSMFKEFFFPYYQAVAENFGLLSYGCCEPVHTIWDESISRLHGLRKVAVTPWCDEEFMGEALRNMPVIYHRKPSPNFIGVGKDIQEDSFRAHIKKTIRCARGCNLEFSLTDIYSLEGNPEKPARAVSIVREMIEDWN